MPYADNEGVRIHYEVFGEGAPIFLYVGAGAEWDLWKLAGYLDRLGDFQLIINDPRGFGTSDRPETLASYRIENQVQDVVAILDDLQISSSAFWGWSDGAWVGFALAGAHPDRLKCLIASGGAVGPPENKDRQNLAKFVQEKGLGFLNGLFEASLGGKLPDWYAERRPQRDPRIFGLQMHAWVPWMKGAWDLFPKIEVPALIITGDKEDPTGQSKKMARLMPDARFVVLRGLRPGSSDAGMNHFDGFMRSDASVRFARPFLRKHLSRGII
jgi:pimeloyl-ACP methyl ester carboxylesterase